MVDLEFLIEKAKGHEMNGQYLEAEIVYSAAMDETRHIDHGSEQGRLSVVRYLTSLHNHRGVARRMLRRYDEAMDDFRAAREQAAPFNNVDLLDEMAHACINMADVQRVGYNNLPAAHQALDEVLRYTKPSSLTCAKAVDQRGLVLVAEKRFEEAILHYNISRMSCEDLLRSDPDNKDVQHRLSQVLLHLGFAYVQIDDSESLEKAYESQAAVIDTLVKLGDKNGIVNAVRTIGQISLRRGNPEEAVKQYTKAQDILQATGYDRATTILGLYLAQAHQDLSLKNMKTFRQGLEAGHVAEQDFQPLEGMVKDVYKKSAHTLIEAYTAGISLSPKKEKT